MSDSASTCAGSWNHSSRPLGSTAMAATLPPADLERLAADARAGGRLGIDTEFMTEGRYHPLLCLVQVSVADHTAEDGVRVELIAPVRGGGAPAPPPPLPPRPEHGGVPPPPAQGRPLPRG